MLRAVTGFMREICTERPVALLLDDLHWVDSASLDLLAHLARHTPGDRVLLVGTYRDVEVGRRHPLRKAVRELGREQLVEKIDVRRLGREETGALMSDRLDGTEVSEEFAGLVYGHTGGNPFFTVEVLKALIERGDLLRWEGSWIRKDIEDLAAPESVSEAITERVSRLQPKTQKALQEASVLGQVFGFEDLMAVVSLGEEEAEEALEEAEASGLVRTARDRYAFNHALTQQTLYAGLSPARRKRLHRSAGEGMTALEKALLLAERSGTLDTLGTALLSLHLAYMVRGEFDRSRECAVRGAATAKKTGDTDLLAMHATNLGLQLFYVGDWREARGYLERAVGLARGTQLSFFSSQPPAYLGVLHKAQGAWEDASRCFSDAAALAREADVPGQLRYAESRLAELDVLQGRPAEAIARLGPRASDPQWLYDVLLLSVLAEAYADTGDPVRAEEVAERALERARLMGNRVDRVEALRIRAKSLSMQGRPEDAIAALEEALSWARSMPYPYAEAKLSREYGMLHLREREPGRTRERLFAALDIFSRLGAKKDVEQTERALGAAGQVFD